MRASAALSLFKAIDATHAHMVFTIHNTYIHIYIHSSGYITEWIADARLPHRRAHVCSCVHVFVRASVCVWLGARVSAPNRASRFFPSAWTACGSGSQPFASAYAFNANIGAWNTASVTTLHQVCAAISARRRATAGTRSAGLRCGAAVVRGGTADAPACVRVLTHVQALACAGVHLGRAYVYPRAGKVGTCVHEYMYAM